MTDSVRLPNSARGRLSETAGFFHVPAERLASWLVAALGEGWSLQTIGSGTVSESIEHLQPFGQAPLRKYLLLESDGWTVVFSDGPLGTDVGVLPSRAARDLGVRAVRATAVDPGSSSSYASVFEVFDDESTDAQLCLRTVYAVDDGGRWRFGELGERFSFEDSEQLAKRRVRDRLGPEAIRGYLEALGAPAVSLDSEVVAHLVERS